MKLQTNWEMDEETQQRYIHELYYTMLSHDGELIEDFAKRWSLSLRNNYSSIVYSYIEVCNQPYYEEKDREEAEAWLRKEGLERYIKKVVVN